jgi:pimeloyl-ACP methyl ester carboxylesterase
VSSVTERRVAANGLTFNLAEAGAGPPVLLLPGFPDCSRLWRYQLAALAEAGHRVIAPDLRGFGETDKPGDVGDYRMRTLGGDAVGLLDALGVDRVAVVGHDWGAGLAWMVATCASDRVSRLVAISVGHPVSFVGAGMARSNGPGTCCGSSSRASPSGCCPPAAGRCSAAGPGTGSGRARIPIATSRSQTSLGRVR